MPYTLHAEVPCGYKGVTRTPLRPSVPILDQSGTPVAGQYPSLWKVSEAGVWSVCWLGGSGSIVRAESLDNLHTLSLTPGGFPLVPIFSRAGGIPVHIRDQSGGVWYVAAAFPAGSDPAATTEDILIARLDGGSNLLHFADGTTQKIVAAASPAAGRPSLTQNRYDPEQPLTLLHGDRRFIGRGGGELWTEILT